MMKLLIIILLFSLRAVSQENLTFEPRPLVLSEYVITMSLPILAFELISNADRDKKLHFEAGYIASATAGYFLRKHTDHILIQVLGTVLSGYLVTYAKEYIWDRGLGMGTFNKQDLNAGGWGSNFAMFSYIFTIRDKVHNDRRNRRD
jgi:hypothetical protein